MMMLVVVIMVLVLVMLPLMVGADAIDGDVVGDDDDDDDDSGRGALKRGTCKCLAVWVHPLYFCQIIQKSPKFVEIYIFQYWSDQPMSG